MLCSRFYCTVMLSFFAPLPLNFDSGSDIKNDLHKFLCSFPWARRFNCCLEELRSLHKRKKADYKDL